MMMMMMIKGSAVVTPAVEHLTITLFSFNDESVEDVVIL